MRAKQKVVLGVAIAVLIVLAGGGGWLLRGSRADIKTTAAPQVVKVGVPTIVTPSELERFAGNHYPVYWAGKRPHTKLELTLTSKDAIFVRYIPHGAKVGDTTKHLTVGTYGDINGYTALTTAKKRVASVVHGRNGAVITVFKSRPNSTYFSFKNAGFQVEVFSPRHGVSKRLTDDGSITLVGGGTR